MNYQISVRLEYYFFLFIISFYYLFKDRYVNRLNIEGLQMFSLGKSNAPYTIAVYIKSKKVMKKFCIRIN